MKKGGIAMDMESLSFLSGAKRQRWQDFLTAAGLEPDTNWEQTVLLWEDGDLIAAGSRQGNLAVDPAHQGEGLLATVLTALRQEAFRQGHRHLFVYTKPANEVLFTSLFFYPVARTDKVLFLENKKNGIAEFLQSLPVTEASGPIGAAVMNCNPFTKGHRYLIETAAAECSHVYVFVLSEDKSHFSTAHRMEMVKLGTADLPNVTVLPTGPYLISSATFPTYFLKETAQVGQIQCLLDLEIFCRHYAPRFGITRRYVGTEPVCPVTGQYNEALKQYLPEKGIELREIPRLQTHGAPVSASTVRSLLNDPQALAALLPETTLTYLQQHQLI